MGGEQTASVVSNNYYKLGEYGKYPRWTIPSEAYEVHQSSMNR